MREFDTTASDGGDAGDGSDGARRRHSLHQQHSHAILIAHVVWATHGRDRVLCLAADAWLARIDIVAMGTASFANTHDA